MKKFASVLLVLVLVFALCTTAMADTDTPATPTAHSYTAYKIFAGTQGANSAQLAQVTWGGGVDSSFLTALQADTTVGSTFTGLTTAAQVANAMAGWSDGSADALAFARVAYAHKTGSGVAVVNGQTELDPGYYLIVDSTEFQTGETDTYRGLALLQLTGKGTFAIAPKTDIPTVVKKVKDIDDSTQTEMTGWQDSADYDIGDTIPFQITATISADTNIAAYKVYKLVFHDTGCAGLKIDDESFVVTIDDGDALTAVEHYTLAVSGDNFTLTIPDVKALGAKDGSKVTVYYEAELDTDAQIGAAGNPNTVYLQYSNDANWTGTGDNSPLGETPKDKVVVFTYQVTVNKVDKEGNALNGAGFTLYKWDASAEGDDKWVAVGEELTGTEMHEFVWNGVDDGQYKLVETTVPDGYNKMDDLVFVVSAEHDITSANPALTELYGGNLQTGEYQNVNRAESGNILANVVNYAGGLLPETGGIGTTIFYVAGAVLLIGATVLLITKKRMENN